MDRDQLLALVTDHHATIWRYLRAAGAEPELADDLVQETFLEVWQKPAPFEYRGAAEAVGYLRTVARHRLIDHRRRQARRGGRHVALEAALDELEAAFTEFVPDGESSDDRVTALRACVEQLGERERDAVAARYREEQELPVIARARRTTVDAIAALLKRARARLRACVQRRLTKGDD